MCGPASHPLMTNNAPSAPHVRGLDEELGEYEAQFFETADLMFSRAAGRVSVVGFEEVGGGPAAGLRVAAVEVGVICTQ